MDAAPKRSTINRDEWLQALSEAKRDAAATAQAAYADCVTTTELAELMQCSPQVAYRAARLMVEQGRAERVKKPVVTVAGLQMTPASVTQMTPYYEHAGIVIYNADCREVLPRLGTVDVVLTDGVPH